MANEMDLGAGRVRLQVDASDFDSALRRAENAAAGFGDRASKAFDSSTGGVRRAAAALLDYTASLGRTREQVDLLTRVSRASRAGVDSDIIEAAIAKHAEYQQELARTTQAQLDQEQTMRRVFSSLAAQDDAYSQQQRLNTAWEEGARDAEKLAQAERDLTREKREEFNATQRQIDAERQRRALVASLVQQDDNYSQQQRLNAAWDEGAADAARLAQSERDLAKAARESFNATQNQIDAERQRSALVASLIRQADAYEESERAATRARGEAGDQQQYLQYLRNLADTAGKSHYEILELKAAQLGLSDQAAPLIAGLKQQGQAMGAGSLSAKQYQAALRGMPAQITDIVVSLQGGINPLTVFLQQGGQIKDMFGGALPALRAFGAELVKLATNPYLLTIAAVASLGYAMYTADDIMDDFTVSLAKSGNFAESTAKQLRDLADSVADTAGTSTRTAAEAINAAVASGQIGLERLTAISSVAAAAQETMGTKVEDTIKTYVKLGEKPLDTLLELNKAENFLTAAQIERIASLEDVGRMQEAANEAIAIYLQSQRETTDAIREAYSPAKSLWVDIKTWVSDATIAVGDFGLATADSLVMAGKWQAGLPPALRLGIAAISGQVDNSGPMAELARREQEAYATSRARATKSASEEAKQAAKTVDFERETKKLKDSQLSTDEKIAQMSERARNAGIDEVRIEQRAAAIREADAKKNRKKGDGGLSNALSSEAMQGFKDQLAQEQAAIETQSKLIEGQYRLRTIDAEAYYAQVRTLTQRDVDAQGVALQKQLDYLNQRSVKGKDAANVQRQIGVLEAQQVKLRETAAQRLNEIDNQQEQARRQRVQAERAYRDALMSTEQAIQRQMETTAARVGMGDRQFEIENRLNEVYRAQADELRQITMQEENRQISATEAEGKRTELYASTQRQLEIITNGYKNLAIEESNWFNGFESAWQNFMQQTSNVADLTKQAWTESFNTIGSVASNTIKGIDTDWKDLLRNMAANLAQQGFNKLLGVAGNYLGGMLGGGSSAGAMMGTTNTFGSNMSNLIGYNAKGGTFENNAGLHQYINSVVSKPTMFAKGGAFNVMGEAGHEAIVPLARDSAGELGVKLKGGGGGNAEITLNVYGGDGKATASAQQDAQGGMSIDVIIGQIDAKMAGNVMNGTSKTDLAMQKKYNLRKP